MKEIEIIRALKKLAKSYKHQCLVEHIESCTSQGLPDLYIALRGVSAWVEVKAPKVPKREHTIVFKSNYFLNESQIAFNFNLIKIKVPCFLLINLDTDFYLFDLRLLKKHEKNLSDLRSATKNDFTNGNILSDYLVYKTNKLDATFFDVLNLKCREINICNLDLSLNYLNGYLSDEVVIKEVKKYD